MSRRGERTVWPHPEALLRHLGIIRPEDIDVEAIARYCNVRISYREMTGCEARLVGRGERAVIVVNKSSHRYRRRFSAAHELGHWMLDRGETAHAYTSDFWTRMWPEDHPEQRANRWAANLLMPESMFLADLRGRETSFATLFDLARRYRTSLTATALRLVDLSPEPAMLVCSRRDRRWKWFKNGPAVPHGIWPVPNPLEGSLAFILLYGTREHIGTLEPSPWDVAADAWIERKDAWWYRVREDSVRSMNREVLSLITWPDRGQLVGVQALHGTWLPWEAGKGARAKLAKCLQEKWDYRRVRGVTGEVTLETEVPSHQRLVLPAVEKLRRRRLRQIVDKVAWHKDVPRDRILLSMLKEPKWLQERREKQREEPREEDRPGVLS